MLFPILLWMENRSDGQFFFPDLTANRLQVAYSQTLYFLFKDRRARSWSSKPRGISWPKAQGGVGGEMFFLTLRARALTKLSKKCPS